MSESKPTPPKSRSSNRRRIIGNHWFAVSVAAHVVAAIALVYFTPIRDIIEQATREQTPEITMSSQQLQELSSSILDINELTVRQNVYELSSLLEMMDALEAHREQQFDVFEQQQRERALVDAQAAMEQAVDRLQAAQSALEAEDPHEANEAQMQATFAQEEALQRLALADDVDSDEVAELQRQARQELEKAIEGQTLYRNKRHVAHETERDIDRQQRDIRNVENDIKRQQDEVERRKSRADDRQAEMDKAQAALDEKPDDKGAMTSLNRHRSHRDSELERMRDAQARLVEREARLEQEQAALKQLEAKLADQQAQRDAARDSAVPMNEAARDLQKQALSRLEGLKPQGQAPDPPRAAIAQSSEHGSERTPEQETAVIAEPDAPLPPGASATATESPAPTQQRRLPLGEHRASYTALGGKDIPDLYEQAREFEQKVTESYKRIRAMELATLRDVTLDQALKNTDVVQPVRPDVDAQLVRGQARSPQRLEAQKREVTRTIQQTEAMVELAQMLLMQLQEHGAEHGGAEAPMTLMVIREQQEAWEEQTQKASQDQSGRIVDLTEPEVLIPAPMIPDEVFPMPAAKFGVAGRSVDWVFIDTWYTIGPFPNPGRANIDRKFPPETAVDLDAAYLGKDNRTIRWQFVQSGHEGGKVVPADNEPYGIWYAYTELKFDQPTEAWIAMGSDDRGTLWINDEVVWISPTSHKPWRPGEALRRVQFPAGRSRVLFRIENGWRDTGFSLLLHAGSAEVAAAK